MHKHPRPHAVFRLFAVLATIFAVTSGAFALDISGPLTIDNGNKATYQNQDIVVLGGVITISVPITFNSLLVKNGGQITHPVGPTN